MPQVLELIFDSVSGGQLAMMAATMVLAGFLRGFVGFGGGLVTVPILTLVFGPLVAVPIATVIALPAAFQLLPSALRLSDRAVVGPLACATMLAAPLGAWMLVAVDPQLMKLVIGGLVIGMVAIMVGGWQLTDRASIGVLAGAGVAGGIVQGCAGVGGPPVVAIVLSHPGSAEQKRGNILGAMTAVSFSSILPLWYHGLFTVNVVVIGLALAPVYSGATWLGARYFSREGQRHYRNAALFTLAAIGMVTLGLSLRDYVLS